MNANSNIWIIGLLSLCLSACGDHSSPAGDEPSVTVPNFMYKQLMEKSSG